MAAEDLPAGDASASLAEAPTNPDDWAPRSPLFSPPPERTERRRAAPASSSWSFLGCCSQPKVARDLELDDVQGKDGYKRWQRDLDKMRDYVAGVEGVVQGQIKASHQQMQECVKRLEKKYVEEMAALRAHLLAGAADPERAQTGGVAEVALLAAEREALRASLVEVHELRDEVHALKSGNAEPRALNVEPEDETEAFAEIEGLKQRMNAEIESVEQRAREQNHDSAKEVYELRVRFLSAMERMQSRRKPGVSRIDLELERFRLTTAIEMQRGLLEAQSDAIGELKRQRMGEDMETLNGQLEEFEERERQDEEFGDTEMNANLPMAVLQKEVAVARAEVLHLHNLSTALESQMSHMKEELQKAIEASSIKAGYLAGALARCDEKERKRIYNLLKKREDDLQIVHTGEVIWDPDVKLCFEVTIDRTDGGDLGVSFDASSGVELKVEEFTGKRSHGLIHKYNVLCQPPQTPVAVGDRIVEVNGIRGYASLLTRELEAKKVLNIVLRR